MSIISMFADICHMVPPQYRPSVEALFKKVAFAVENHGSHYIVEHESMKWTLYNNNTVSG